MILNRTNFFFGKNNKQTAQTTPEIIQQSSLIQKILGKAKETLSPVGSFLTKQYQGLKEDPTKDFSTASILRANISPEQKTEESNETQYEPTNITQETLKRLPKEIKETTAEGLLELPNIIRKSLGILPRPDYKPIKKAIIEKYGLTKIASNLWDDAKFELKAQDEQMPYGLHYQPVNIASDVISEYIPQSVEKVPEKIWEKFEQLSPKGKALIEIYKQAPEIVLHELGHLFLSQGIMESDKSNKVIASFSNQWDKLNEEDNEFTIYIDDIIYNSYERQDSINPNVLLQERYAIMFELAGMYGVNEVPTVLQKYIKPFIKIK